MAIVYRKLTFSISADSHSAGDVVAATEQIANFASSRGGAAKVVSVFLVDESDTGAALDIVFFDRSSAIGNESATYTVADGVAINQVGTINVLTTHYDDNVDNKVATVSNINLIMGCQYDENSLWAGLVARGSINPAATNDITIKLGIEQ